MQIEKTVGNGDQAVYVFHFPCQHRPDGDFPCKIGHTTTGDVRKRLASYQAGMQEAPTVSLVVLCDDSQSLEAHLHNSLADKRIAAYGSEWFMTTPETVLSSALGYQIPSNEPLRISSTQSLGKAIRAARIRQGLSQKDLAKMNFTNQAWISEIENGKNSAEIGRVFGVLFSLGIELDISRKSRAHADAV